MNRDSHLVTNLLLLLVLGLLVVGLAIPSAPAQAPAPAAPAARGENASARKLEDLVARVELLLQTAPAPAAAPAAPAPADDEIVVCIPGKLARDLGITAADVRVVVEGLAKLAKMEGARRRPANETAAVATARNCCSAQAQFQATAKADVDGDGVGEFGSFVELSGAKAVRGISQFGKLNPPVLSGAFRNPSAEGFVSRSGYFYVIYLPDGAGDGVAADRCGYQAVDPDRAEKCWCMYAWPVNHAAGQRTFMVNQTGDVLATSAREYTGKNAPQPGAAFTSGGMASIAGRTAIGRRGQDGHDWTQVN